MRPVIGDAHALLFDSVWYVIFGATHVGLPKKSCSKVDGETQTGSTPTQCAMFEPVVTHFCPGGQPGGVTGFAQLSRASPAAQSDLNAALERMSPVFCTSSVVEETALRTSPTWACTLAAIVTATKSKALIFFILLP
jgi:hypothetical protein